MDIKKFAIAMSYTNDTGHQAFVFSPNPFVHNVAHTAEAEARRLARQHERPFSVFGLLYTVEPIVEVDTHRLDADELAESLAQAMAEQFHPVPIQKMRIVVNRTLARMAGVRVPVRGS